MVAHLLGDRRFVYASSDGSTDEWYMIGVDLNNGSIKFELNMPSTGNPVTHCAVCSVGHISKEYDAVILAGVYNGDHEILIIDKDGNYWVDVTVDFGVGDWVFETTNGTVKNGNIEVWGIAVNWDDKTQYHYTYIQFDDSGSPAMTANHIF